MSSGPRIPLAEARTIAARVVAALGIGEHTVVGSVRRECAEVGDIELCVPHPARAYQEKLEDPLFDSLCRHIRLKDEAPDLLTPIGRFGTEVKGIKKGFRYCQFIVNDAKRPDHQRVGVEIHRYRESGNGLGSNRGWQVLHRTGPEEFAQAVLKGWKARHRRSASMLGSDDGFLVDDAGRPTSTPDEMSIFDRLCALWVEPKDRIGADSFISFDERVQEAGGGRLRLGLGAQGLESVVALKERVLAQREINKARRAIPQETTA